MINDSALNVRLDLPRIYPITDTRLSRLSHAEQVARLIEGGASLIQLRDKFSAPREFYRDAAAALQIAHAHGAKLIINDRVDIALALKADGVHLGQTDIPAAAARRLLGKEAIIGFSTHNPEQAKLTLERASTVFKAGADSLAVITDLVADPTRIAENMSEMISLTYAVPNAPSRS